MILLGVNCGFGNTDYARLPFSAIDLDGGWVRFPRPKTGVDRRCPLWPETVKAIRDAIERRPLPRTDALAEFIFLTRNGNSWCDSVRSHSPLAKRFESLARRAGVSRTMYRSFYGLRRTFETIGGDARDQVAVDYIMGHAPASGDMAAVYRQRIDDERLLAVTEHIRWWLSPDKSQVEIDHQRRLQQKAAQIVEAWEVLDRLKGSDVELAIERLGVEQKELARGVGCSQDWINILIRERDGKRIGSDMDLRLRFFMSQLSEGRTPTPFAKNELRTQSDNPLEFPLSDEALAVLDHQPLMAVDLRVVVDCLKESGVLQATLAKWWGYEFKRLREMLCGNMKIPKRGADRLREIFGLAPKLRNDLPPAPAYANSQQLPVTSEVKSIFDSPEFAGPQIRALTIYLRRKHGITQKQLNAWLKPGHQFVGNYSFRFTNSPGLRASLRQLFAFKSEGGAQ